LSSLWPWRRFRLGARVLEDYDTRKKLVDAGADVEPMSVHQFRAFVDAESSKYARIIKETGVHAE